MKKVALLVMAALALFAFSSAMTRAADNNMSITMNAENGSSEDGTATVTGMGTSDIKVVLDLKNGPAEPQPAHIHKGTCANLNPSPAFPLSNVVSGKSETTVMVNMADLEKGQYAINVHKSATEAKTYVSCGDLAAMMTGGQGGTMPATGNGDQPLVLAALALAAVAMTGAGFKLARRKA